MESLERGFAAADSDPFTTDGSRTEFNAVISPPESALVDPPIAGTVASEGSCFAHTNQFVQTQNATGSDDLIQAEIASKINLMPVATNNTYTRV